MNVHHAWIITRGCSTTRFVRETAQGDDNGPTNHVKGSVDSLSTECWTCVFGSLSRPNKYIVMSCSYRDVTSHRVADHSARYDTS